MITVIVIIVIIIMLLFEDEKIISGNPYYIPGNIDIDTRILSFYLPFSYFALQSLQFEFVTLIVSIQIHDGLFLFVFVAITLKSIWNWLRLLRN